jgi:MFS superfamily sulfate permease-like transporter
MALAAGLLRLGFLAGFISEPVLKGFVIGLALVIMVGQVPKLFGIEGSDGNFFRQVWEVGGNLDDTHGRSAAVGLGSLALVVGLRRLAPIVPGSLAAVFGGIVAVHLLDLDDAGVAIVGSIESGFPALGVPDGVGFHDYLAAAGSAVGLVLVGFAALPVRRGSRRCTPPRVTRFRYTGSRRTQRKPRCEVEVSIAWAMRAAGR